MCVCRYIWMCMYRWEQRSWNVQGWRGLIILRQCHRHHRFATAEFSFVIFGFSFCLCVGFLFLFFLIFFVTCLFLFVYLVWEIFVKWGFHDWGSMANFLFIYISIILQLRLVEGIIAYSLNYDVHVRLIIIKHEL